LPFLSIIDQNAHVIEEVFKTSIGEAPTSDLFLIHHHLSDYTYKAKDTEYTTDESEILVEGWDSEIIITTFVQLFHTLFSNKNRAIRKFHKTAGSIIILDEIQSLPHEYWMLFREIAKAMSKYLGTYFILSTATQPAIFEKTKELLINGEKYFNSLKRTRVKIKIDPPKTTSEFAKELIQSLIENPKSILLVLNTIKSAEELFREVKQPLKDAGYKVYFLSSHVTPYERLERIEQIKKSRDKKVIISTQLVEAGVDIDLEKVIRDFGPMDSINQVAGRANRNYNLDFGEVEVIRLKDEKNQRYLHSYIYDPVLISNTEEILKNEKEIGEDNFLNLTTQYFKSILETTSDDLSQEYINAIRMLDYEKIGEFQLIKEKGEKVDIFVELNDEASDVWNRYQQIVKITDLRERKRQFLGIRGKFYQYVISVLVYKAKENLPPEVSGIRFISKAQLNEFYDLETGFKLEGESFIW
jgi:CRISPR-associated endonuclease/helicase Cas3